MPDIETTSVTDPSGSTSTPILSTSPWERAWRWMEWQPALVALCSATVVHVLLVLVARIAGEDIPWFQFTIVEVSQAILLIVLLYLFFQGLVVLHRKSLSEVHCRVNGAMKDAQSRIDAIAEQNIQIQKESVEGFAKISEARDFSSGQHIQRMKEYAKAIASALGRVPKYSAIVDQQYVLDIHIAAPLHDIGKVGTRDDILKKRGKLSGEEFELMKMHTIIGGDLMAELEVKLPGTSFFKRAREIAYHHHQRWDGSGYPNILTIGDSVAYFVEPGVGHPLKGDGIPLSARIVALADVYDALRSRRVYKEPFTHETARDMILQERGKHFDPDVVDAFFEIEAEILQIAASFKD